MENITKRFGKVVANNAINMELHEGEILSLLGENGSGKTTLMNMLSGIYFPDEGQIYIHDQPVTIASPKDAFALGIGMIHQHFKLVDLFTATENIILGLEGKLDLANARKKVQEICDRYGFDIDPDMKIYDMSVSQKQTVEIVKVLYRGADILILDEPTAVLTPNEKGTGYCLAQANGDVRTLTKALNTALSGRGGGKPGICQGSCAATPEEVEKFLKENHEL